MPSHRGDANREKRRAVPGWLLALGIVGLVGWVVAGVVPALLVAACLIAYLLVRLSRIEAQVRDLDGQVRKLAGALAALRDERGTARAETVVQPGVDVVMVPAPMTQAPMAPAPATPAPATQAPAALRPSEPADWEGLWRFIAGPLSAQAGSTTVGTAEARIGTVWLSRIGILLILVSAIVGYIMLNSTGLQAAIGWAAGLTLLGLGRWGYRKGYGPWSQAVNGGAIGLLYVVTTAAATIFDPPVIPVLLAFTLMVLITGLGTFLAVSHDSIALGVLAMVGGFATPFLLSSGEGSFQVLFTYVAILDLGLLGVAWFKRWPVYNYLLFAATWLIYGTWWSAAYTPADRQGAFLFASLFFIIFAGVSIQYNILHRKKSHYQDLGVVLANGFLFFTAGLKLVPGGDLRVLFAFAMAAVHLGLGYLTLRRNPVDRMMRLSFFALGGVFLTIAFPVALHGPWITVAWALEAASLTWISFLTQEPWARWGGLSVFALAAGRLLIWETFPGLFGQAQAGVVMRGFTFLVSIAAFYLAIWAYGRFRCGRRPMIALAVAANFLTLWYITREITLAQVSDLRLVTIAGAWGLYGLLLAMAERKFSHASVRIGAWVVLAGALSCLAVVALLNDARRAWVGYRYLGYLIPLGAVWASELSFKRYGDDPRIQGALSLVAAFVGFWLGGLEVTGHFRGTTAIAAVMIWGGLYGLAVLLAGIRLRSLSTRLMGVGIIGIAGGPLLVVMDLRWPPFAPWNLQIGAFLCTIGGLYLAAWLVRRFRDRVAPLDLVVTEWAALGGILLTLLWINSSVEGLEVKAETLQDFLYSAAYGCYGFLVLAVGFVIRHRRTRLVALGIVGLTIAKIGLSDMWSLAPIWRFWIGLGIGSMLLVASLAYQRFAKLILGEPTSGQGPGA